MNDRRECCEPGRGELDLNNRIVFLYSSMRGQEASYVFFHKPGFELDQAEARFVEEDYVLERKGDTLEVIWDDDEPVTLYIRYLRGPEVTKMALKAGHSSEYRDLLRTCDAAFEITFDDLDKVLDETHSLIETQGLLGDATGGVVSRSWNDELSGPD